MNLSIVSSSEPPSAPPTWESRINGLILEEADAQRAVWACQDTMLTLERKMKLLEAGAAVACQDGRNAETREAMVRGMLAEDTDYQAARKDADELRRDLRELQLTLTTTTHVRQLASDLLRRETAQMGAG